MSTEIKPNVDRLYSLLDWATQEWEKKEKGLTSEWNQSHWATRNTRNIYTLGSKGRAEVLPAATVCGSACCLAGRTGIEDGYLPMFERGRETSTVFSNGMQTVLIWDYAQEALGLSSSQADRLFHGGNDLDDVQEIVAGILAGEQYMPEPDNGDE